MFYVGDVLRGLCVVVRAFPPKVALDNGLFDRVRGDGSLRDVQVLQALGKRGERVEVPAFLLESVQHPPGLRSNEDVRNVVWLNVYVLHLLDHRPLALLWEVNAHHAVHLGDHRLGQARRHVRHELLRPARRQNGLRVLDVLLALLEAYVRELLRSHFGKSGIIR